MQQRAPGTLLASLLALGFVACPPPATQVSAGPEEEAAASSPVARIGSEVITAGDLDTYIKEQLYDRETRGGNPGKVYELRSQYLDRLLTQRAVEAAAAEAGLSEVDLLERDAAALGEISDEEIAAFYEKNKARLGEADLETVKPRIRDHLEAQRAPIVIGALRERSDAVVLLEPERAEVSADGPALGPENAPVTIVEFSDFECPYCKRAIPIVEALRERYPEEVRVVYRHLPLDRIHSRARPAAEAAMCAHDQGQFWAYHDKLFEGRALADEDLRRYASELGLDEDAFGQCLESRSHRATVQADSEAATELGVTGTPAFFVNGILISGAKPVDAFAEVIDKELAKADGAAAGS